MRNWMLLLVLGCGGNSSTPPIDSVPSDDAPTDAPGDGPQIGPPDDGRSGTRLKRVGYRTADGFLDHMYWRDTVLDVTCVFGTVADGSSRCGPRSVYSASMRYRDAACTDRIFNDSMAFPPSVNFFTSDSLCGPMGPTCGPTSWKITTAIAAPAVVYRSDPTNGCVAAPTTGVFYEATQILPSQMVGETVTLEPTAGRLMTRVRTTDDGGREFIHVFDPALNEHCLPRFLADDRSHCAPLWTTRSSSEFSDAACMIEALRFATVDPEGDRKYLLRQVPGTCRGTVSFARIAPHAGAVYRLMLQQCVLNLATPPPGLTFKSVGAPLASSEMLTEMSRSISPGPKRVRLTYGNYEDGSVGRKHVFWDTTHETECEFTNANSGVTACVPRDYLDFDGEYADAGCTQMIALTPQPCSGARFPRFARYGNNNDRYHRVGAELAITTAYAGTPASCVQIAIPAGAHIFAVDPTPIINWDPGTLQVEP